jgi:hypothetical protein
MTLRAESSSATGIFLREKGSGGCFILFLCPHHRLDVTGGGMHGSLFTMIDWPTLSPRVGVASAGHSTTSWKTVLGAGQIKTLIDG